MPWRYLVVFVASLYIASARARAGVWFGISRVSSPGCLSGFEEESHGFNAAVTSVATQTHDNTRHPVHRRDCRTGTFVRAAEPHGTHVTHGARYTFQRIARSEAPYSFGVHKRRGVHIVQGR